MNLECETLRMRGSMPVSIEEQKQAKILAYSRKRDNASYLRNYVWAHFWLFVPYVLQVVAGFIFQAKPTAASFLKYFDVVLTLLCGIANVYILLRMTKVEKGFLKTGLLFAVYFVADILATVLPVTSYVPEMTTLPASLVGMYATYMEYGNYSNLMQKFDGELSEKWFRLHKFYIICLAGIVGCLLLTQITMIIGALLFLTCLFGLLGVSILTFIYRYKSAKEICVYGS